MLLVVSSSWLKITKEKSKLGKSGKGDNVSIYFDSVVILTYYETTANSTTD